MSGGLVLTTLIVPLLGAVGCLVVRRAAAAEQIALATGGITTLFGLAATVAVARGGAVRTGWHVIRVDELSALMITTVVVLGFAACLVSIDYLRNDLGRGEVPQGEKGVRLYYAGMLAFIWTMLATVSVDNLGLLWVGVEATTLASALLVGFYRSRAALEAAWKYLILCTVGITCALFGVMLTYYAGRIGAGEGTLNWSGLVLRADRLDPDLMRLAFVFILIGFGTKAGFAPLHTWLADAHSQAPSPVSGLLSGVLLTCAFYGIVRFHTLTAAATGDAFSANLLIAFGVLSVAVAVPFILLARDIKRMLAYSSVEHIGIMALAFGVGGPVAVTAGLLHIVNHAATKGLLFFVTGDIVQRHHGTRRIRAIRGLLRSAPVLGWLFIIGVLAITGAPPFGMFISEIGIFGAAIDGRPVEIAAAVTVMLLLGVIFGGLLKHLLGIAYGSPPVETGAAAQHAPHRLSWFSGAAFAPLLVVMLLFGVHVPGPVDHLLREIADIVEPSTRAVAAR